MPGTSAKSKNKPMTTMTALIMPKNQLKAPSWLTVVAVK